MRHFPLHCLNFTKLTSHRTAGENGGTSGIPFYNNTQNVYYELTTFIARLFAVSLEICVITIMRRIICAP